MPFYFVQISLIQTKASIYGIRILAYSKSKDLIPIGSASMKKMNPPSGNKKGNSVAEVKVATVNELTLSTTPSLIPWLIGTGIVGLFYLLLKMYNMHPYIGDESIYIYQGKLVADGFTPYRDFAMAHPPLQTIFIAFIIKVFGYSLLGFRMIPTLWTLASGILLSVMVRRELGTSAAVSAMALFILAYEPLRASIHFTGVNMTITFLMGAYLAHRYNKILLCAILGTLAIYTRLYALPAVFTLLIATFIIDKKQGTLLLKWQLILGAVLFLLFGLWTGFAAMMNDIFLFQAQKTKMSLDKLQDMRDGVLFHNSIPFVLFILGAITVIGMKLRAMNTPTSNNKKTSAKEITPNPDLTLVWISILTVFLTLGILLNMSRVWMYYYVLAFPFAAIASGWMVSLWIKKIRTLLPTKNVDLKNHPAIGLPWLISSILIFFIAWGTSPRLEKNLEYYKDAIKISSSQHRTIYPWREAPVPGFINQLVKSLIWKDERVIGDRYSEFTYYLWHSCRILDICDEAVAELVNNTTENDEIFGDSGTVPLLALLSKRRIAGNEIDTNIERYRSGNADPDKLIRNIDKPTTKYIFLQDRFGVATVTQIQQLVNLKYKLVKEFKSPTGGTNLKMYERLPG